MKTTKKILLGLSSLGLASPHIAASARTPIQTESPLGLSAPLSPNAKANIDKITRALKQASGGKVNANNVMDAINRVRQNNPSISLSAMASALSQLKLDKEGAKNAVLVMASAYDTSESKAAEALITETVLNEGITGTLITDLRDALGDDVVNAALESKGEIATREATISEGLHYNNSPYSG